MRYQLVEARLECGAVAPNRQVEQLVDGDVLEMPARLRLASPLAAAAEPIPVSPRDLRRRDLLAGLVHEYYRVVA